MKNNNEAGPEKTGPGNVRKGNFVWKDGIVDGEVQFKEDPEGNYLIKTTN